MAKSKLANTYILLHYAPAVWMIYLSHFAVVPVRTTVHAPGASSSNLLGREKTYLKPLLVCMCHTCVRMCVCMRASSCSSLRMCACVHVFLRVRNCVCARACGYIRSPATTQLLFFLAVAIAAGPRFHNANDPPLNHAPTKIQKKKPKRKHVHTRAHITPLLPGPRARNPSARLRCLHLIRRSETGT